MLFAIPTEIVKGNRSVILGVVAWSFCLKGLIWQIREMDLRVFLAFP
jgi:hypothetical protein